MGTVTGVTAYDEMYAGSSPREPQAELHRVLERLTAEELHARARLRDGIFAGGVSEALGVVVEITQQPM